MKCKACNGTGKIKAIDFTKPDWKDTEKVCPICCGSGVIEQTNDEWRKTCSTEEFAEFLEFIVFDWNKMTSEDILEWLKQPHTEKEKHK